MSSSQGNGVFGQQDQTSGTSQFNALSFLVGQALSRLNTITLVKIIGVTNAGGVSPVGFVDVQPLVNQMTGDRKAVAHGVIYHIPYFRLQGGANAVILDPQVGDIGICGFCSRDISAVKSTKKAANPGSYRSFDWADGLYFGGVLNGAPTQYVQFSTAGITVKSPVAIKLDAPTTTITGNLIVQGTSRLQGLLTWLANMVGTGSSTINDKDVGSGHTHSGVTIGGANTGGPT